MQAQSHKLRIEQVDGAHVVALSGKILDPVCIDTISDRLNELASSQSRPKIVLDFSDVSHMSSSALGMLTTLHEVVANHEGKLCLCCIRPAIADIFRITRIEEVLVIQPGLDEAIFAVR